MEKQEYAKGIIFLLKAVEVCDRFDETVDFKCTICGGKAHVFRTSYNGHRHAYCDDCGMDVRE